LNLLENALFVLLIALFPCFLLAQETGTRKTYFGGTWQTVKPGAAYTPPPLSETTSGKLLMMDYKQALEEKSALRKEAALRFDKAESLLSVAKDSIKNGNFNISIEILQDVIETYPDNITNYRKLIPYTLKAYCYAAIRDKGRALSAMSKVNEIALFKDFPSLSSSKVQSRAARS
jgi:tetratricopeptide (TPR) repeat protein